MLSSEGQLAVESVGFQPLLPADRAANMTKLSSIVPARMLPVTLRR
jgi:hypothetical protein